MLCAVVFYVLHIVSIKQVPVCYYGHYRKITGVYRLELTEAFLVMSNILNIVSFYLLQDVYGYHGNSATRILLPSLQLITSNVYKSG